MFLSPQKDNPVAIHRHSLPAVHSPLPLATTNLPSVSMGLPAYNTWPFLLSVSPSASCFRGPANVVVCVALHSFLWPHNIPRNCCTLFGFSIHRSMDIWLLQYHEMHSCKFLCGVQSFKLCVCVCHCVKNKC